MSETLETLRVRVGNGLTWLGDAGNSGDGVFYTFWQSGVVRLTKDIAPTKDVQEKYATYCSAMRTWVKLDDELTRMEAKAA